MFKRISTGLARVLAIVFALSLFVCLTPGTVKAQDAITFGEPVIINNFPDSLTFQITVESTSGEINKAEFIFNEYGVEYPDSNRLRIIEVEPAQEITLEYTWDTTTGIYPWSSVAYSWQARDSLGNFAQTEIETFIYEDTRFTWQRLEDDRAEVWWHDNDSSFGNQVLAIANTAIEEQGAFFQLELEEPIQAIIYNSYDEYNAWAREDAHRSSGMAYAGHNLIFANTQNTTALEEILSHEIGHIYFHYYLGDKVYDVPVWLNEGIAQYLEPVNHSYVISWTQSQMQDDAWLSLFVLGSNHYFYGEDRQLSYAEAYCAVLYMTETYGEQSILDLLDAYKEGKSTDKAFEAVFGLTLSEFEAEWLVWLQNKQVLEYPSGEYSLPWAKLAVGGALLLSMGCGISIFSFALGLFLIFRQKKLPKNDPAEMN
ncbi:MAG: hypothetical protein JXB38_18515 [Anaerolineales bacterium]|nr:hypothetical protein [Anaerolineales bacterium]